MCCDVLPLLLHGTAPHQCVVDVRSPLCIPNIHEEGGGCTVLHYTLLNCIVQHCTALLCPELFCAALYFALYCVLFPRLHHSKGSATCSLPVITGAVDNRTLPVQCHSFAYLHCTTARIFSLLPFYDCNTVIASCLGTAAAGPRG